MSPPYFLFKNCFSDPFLLFVLLLLPWWFPTFQNFFSHQLLLRFVFSQFCPPPPILCRCLRPAPCSKNSPTPNVPCPCAQLSIDSLNTSSVQRKSASSSLTKPDFLFCFLACPHLGNNSFHMFSFCGNLCLALSLLCAWEYRDKLMQYVGATHPGKMIWVRIENSNALFCKVAKIQ